MTIGIPAPASPIQPSSSRIFARSRWLVGSSSSSASGSATQARAISASRCQPPLSCRSGRACSSAGAPKRSRMRSTRQPRLSRSAGGIARRSASASGRSSRGRRHVLRHQRHPQAPAGGDAARARLGQPGDAPQQAGFAGAVAGDEAEAVAVGEGEAEVLEQRLCRR